MMKWRGNTADSATPAQYDRAVSSYQGPFNLSPISPTPQTRGNGMYHRYVVYGI